MSLRAALALTSAATLLSGCVAAAIPLAAGGMIARQHTNRDEAAASVSQPTLKTAEARAAMETFEAPSKPSKAEPGLHTTQARAATQGFENAQMQGVPTGLTALPPPSARGVFTPDARLQQYQPLLAYLSAQLAARAGSTPLNSVVMAPGSRIDAPAFEPCGQKPLAMIFDLDEAQGTGGDPDARWRRWKGDGTDSVVAAPGAVEAIAAARRNGVTIIYTSSRSPTGAPGIAALLDRLGLGPVELGRTLFLQGSSAAPGNEDMVRQAVSARYCVVALAGDEPADFTGQLGTGGGRTGSPRAATSGTQLASLWDAGWFTLPNPVRSTKAAAQGK